MELKVIQRCQRAVDKDTKPLKKDPDYIKDRKESLHKRAGEIDGVTLFGSSYRMFAFKTRSYPADQKLDDNLTKRFKDMINFKPEVKIQIPVEDFYNFFGILAKVATSVTATFSKDKVKVVANTLKKTVGAENFISFELKYPFGVDYTISFNPQYLRDALIPAKGILKEVTLGAKENENYPFKIMGGYYETLIAPTRSKK